jgi:hypothetical protein
MASGQRLLVGALDKVLGNDRAEDDGSKKTFVAKLGELPDGVMVGRLGHPEHAWLIWKGYILRWSPEKYMEAESKRNGEEVIVLTPRGTVATIGAGYLPDVHPSTTV